MGYEFGDGFGVEAFMYETDWDPYIDQIDILLWA